MNTRKACLVGLAAGATLLAGCVAQYRNPNACEQEMVRRLADVSPAKLSVTHSAVSYQGKRVVIEGNLDRVLTPASEAAAASAASGASGAAVAASASAASGVSAAAAQGASSAAMAAAASGAQAASATTVASEPKATTPVAEIVQKLGIKSPVHPPAAAECTFTESGLAAFRWLSPPQLAKTTPDPNAAAN